MAGRPMRQRRAGVLAALALGLGLAVAVAGAAVGLGHLDLVGGLALMLAMMVVLVIPAAFTGWLCAPRVVAPGRGSVAPSLMAAVTASTSTAAFVWAVMIGGALTLDVVHGRLDPGSWTLDSLGGWIVVYAIGTSFVWLASLVVTVPIGAAWTWLTRRAVGRG